MSNIKTIVITLKNGQKVEFEDLTNKRFRNLVVIKHINFGRFKKGCDNIVQVTFTNLQLGAKYRNLPFEISIEYIWDLYLKQHGNCGLTGEPIAMKGPKINYVATKATASLDRIDSSKGYIEGNLWWIHRDLNTMKLALPLDRFRYICAQVHNTASKSNSLQLLGAA